MKLQMSQWMLLIIGDRAVRTYEKYKDLPAVAAHESTLLPVVIAYTDAYRALQAQVATKMLRLEEGRTRVLELYAGLLSWLGMVARDIPGFTLDPQLQASAPDRVIAFAESLLVVVQQHADRLSFAARLIASITTLLEAARQEWEAAQLSLGQHQTMQATVRDRGIVLQRELVAFRRTLRSTVGARNRDLRLLRVGREDAPVEIEGEATEVATQPGTTPAPVTVPTQPVVPLPPPVPVSAPSNGISVPPIPQA